MINYLDRGNISYAAANLKQRPTRGISLDARFVFTQLASFMNVLLVHILVTKHCKPIWGRTFNLDGCLRFLSKAGFLVVNGRLLVV